MISRPYGVTGSFADTHIDSIFDDITREEPLYVKWDPRKNGHTIADYSLDDLKEAVRLLESSIIAFAKDNNISL